MKSYSVTNQILGNYGISKTHTGKACILGEGMEFDGTGSRSLTLIDTVRNSICSDICFISCIIDNDGAMFIRIIHPLLEFFFIDDCSGRIVREAEIDKISFLLWKLRSKSMLCITRHINDAVKETTFLVIIPCSSCHNIRINIYRINRVADCNYII